jgi:hypothetical protein
MCGPWIIFGRAYIRRPSIRRWGICPTPVTTTTWSERVFFRHPTVYPPASALPRPNQCHHPGDEMSKRNDSINRLLPSTSMSRFGKEEKRREPLVISAPMQLPRRRTSPVRVTPNEDPTGSEQHSPPSQPQTPTSASAKLLRMTSKVGLKSLETSSSASLRSTFKSASKPPSAPAQPKNTFRSKAPRPLKLDEKTVVLPYEQQPLSSWETATPSYEEQFRRRRGDLLHRLGPSVPYMQAYDSTSLQW